MGRMAGMGQVAQFLKEAFMPAGASRMGRAADLAMSYGPDLAFAGLAAATAPGGPNLGVGLEDLGISLLGSSLGRVGGRFAGQTFFPRNEEAMGRLSQAADMAISMPLQVFAPRPVLNSAIDNTVKSQKAQEQAQQDFEEHKLYEQLANALFTGGGLAVSGALSPSAGAAISALN